MVITHATVIRRFSYHSVTPQRAEEIEGMRARFLALAFEIADRLPHCSEATKSLDLLEESMFQATASLARMPDAAEIQREPDAVPA
jgi:hypothetical protein